MKLRLALLSMLALAAFAVGSVYHDTIGVASPGPSPVPSLDPNYVWAVPNFTAVPGHCAMFAANGQITDSGVMCATAAPTPSPTPSSSPTPTPGPTGTTLVAVSQSADSGTNTCGGCNVLNPFGGNPTLGDIVAASVLGYPNGDAGLEYQGSSGSSGPPFTLQETIGGIFSGDTYQYNFFDWVYGSPIMPYAQNSCTAAVGGSCYKTAVLDIINAYYPSTQYISVGPSNNASYTFTNHAGDLIVFIPLGSGTFGCTGANFDGSRYSGQVNWYTATGTTTTCSVTGNPTYLIAADYTAY